MCFPKRWKRLLTCTTTCQNRDNSGGGAGPYYLDSANQVAKTMVLKNFAIYPDLADRWYTITNHKIYLPLVLR